MHVEPGPGQLRRWEQRSELPLFAVSLVFLAGYATRVLAPEGAVVPREAALAATLAAWAVFVADYGVRLALSGERWRFPRRNWLDTVVVILPLLRPLRIVRIYTTVQRRRTGRPRLNLYTRVITYTGLSAVLLGFTAALAVYQAEHGAPGATIRTFGDAVWWACSAITTVGYGDVTPVTPTGRVVAVVLMVFGLVLLGAVTGSFSSWLLQVFRQEARDAGDEQDGGNTARPPEG